MLLVAAAGGWIALPVSAQDGAPPPIATIPSDGFNMKVVEQPTPYYVVTTLDPPVFNWFAGTFTNLPTDKEVTIGLNMNGMDTFGGKADVSKWAQLWPVMTFADPNRRESYEWFQKDNKGRWVSGDPLKQGEARFAGTGEVPNQSVIPADVAKDFLSADGAYWQAWREVDRAEAVAQLNIFRMTQRFAHPTATVAMRYPFPYALLQEYIDAIRLLQYNRFRIRVVGQSAEHRDLYAIEVKSSRFFVKQPGTLLLYAREHGTEPDGSWAIVGILNAVLDGTLESWPRLSLIPILDPDSVVACRYEGMINSFDQLDMTPESRALTAYARTLKDDHQYLDTAVGLHNVECGEAPNLWMPHADFMRWWAIEKIKKRIEDSATARKYTISSGVREMTFQGNRFEGWVADKLHTVSLLYELNSRAPNARLTLKRLQEIGPLLVTGVDESQLRDEWIGEFRRF